MHQKIYCCVQKLTTPGLELTVQSAAIKKADKGEVELSRKPCADKNKSKIEINKSKGKPETDKNKNKVEYEKDKPKTEPQAS